MAASSMLSCLVCVCGDDKIAMQAGEKVLDSVGGSQLNPEKLV